MKKLFSDEQIISILREAKAGVSSREFCRKHAISDATFYAWRKKFGGMEVSEVKRLKSPEIGGRPPGFVLWHIQPGITNVRFWHNADRFGRNIRYERKTDVIIYRCSGVTRLKTNVCVNL